MNFAQNVKESFGSRVLIVRYEDLTTNPLDVSKDLCRFLDVQDDGEADAMVARRTSKRTGSDPTIQATSGAASKWQFEPQGEIIKTHAEAGAISDAVSCLLNNATLNHEALVAMGYEGPARSAKEVSEFFGYEANWGKSRISCDNLQLRESKKRLYQFGFEIVRYSRPRVAGFWFGKIFDSFRKVDR
ncbi:MULTISPECIES: sulfotransferase domain-containing protein [unclassified Thioalkalivibrio]|uniref:sulfotransferase domain-containing protein n=1 Tax=unclassified Thioalkalivibrio TaxID=2621013 RepID=UPI0012DC982A|nr:MULTISPECIES: sulfotransferase domain-containing protein [unclassified Thioalkalivibrio]